MEENSRQPPQITLLKKKIVMDEGSDKATVKARCTEVAAATFYEVMRAEDPTTVLTGRWDNSRTSRLDMDINFVLIKCRVWPRLLGAPEDKRYNFR